MKKLSGNASCDILERNRAIVYLKKPLRDWQELADVLDSLADSMAAKNRFGQIMHARVIAAF